MAERKERFAVISNFEKRCKTYGIASPIINKYNEQWAADALLESFDIEDIYNTMTYYFEINPRPTWKGFANNVDKLIDSMKAKQEDDRLRSERRKRAKEWLND